MACYSLTRRCLLGKEDRYGYRTQIGMGMRLHVPRWTLDWRQYIELYCLDLSRMGSVVHIHLWRGGLVELGHIALGDVAMEILFLLNLNC